MANNAAKIAAGALVIAPFIVVSPVSAQVTLPKTSINNAQPVFCVDPATMATNNCQASVGNVTIGNVSLGAGNNTIGSVAPLALTTTNASGSVTSGGSFQNILSSSAGRKACIVVNGSAETEYVYFGAGTANLTNSIPFSPLTGVSCNTPGGVLTDEVQLTGNTTGDKFVLMSQ